MIIKDVTKKIGSGATPTGGAKAYTHNGISLIRSQNVQDMSFDYEGLAHINEEQAAKLNNVEVERDDVLLNITGDSIARCCIVPDDVLPARVNQHVAIIRTKKVSSKYLLYFLQFLKPHLLQICNVGGTRNALTKEAIEKLPFWEISNSNNVAKLLDSLDSKIRNNNAINSELESMAKTLYDYWFLQFEFPNEEGKPYKSSGGKMVWDDELEREIPAKWNARKIGDILIEADKSKIQVNGAKEKGKYPFFTSGESILSYDGFFVDDFNIFLNTGGNPDIKAYMGKCAYSTDTWCISAKEYSYVLYYYFLKLMPQFEQLFFAGSGLKHLQKDALKNKYILLPEEKVLRSFNNNCDSIWKSKSNRFIQNQELSSHRDFLLPLLMNGQVTFK